LNPSDFETRQYFVDFCNKYSISLESLNEIGHDVHVNLEGHLIGSDDKTMSITVKTVSNPFGIAQPKPTGPPPGGNIGGMNGGGGDPYI